MDSNFHRFSDGPNSLSCVVDRYLKVYGVNNLRIADGSIMPRVTTGNTMGSVRNHRRACSRNHTG